MSNTITIALFAAVIGLVVAIIMAPPMPNPEGETELGCGTLISATHVDGCDYVIFRGPKMGGVTHSGNCRNH